MVEMGPETLFPLADFSHGRGDVSHSEHCVGAFEQSFVVFCPSDGAVV